MEATDKWVAEFFLRRKTNPRVSSTNLLSALKLGDSSAAADDGCSNLKLKKASVLRDISDSLICGDVGEGTLDLLETLEKLLQGSSALLMESLNSAYCWTAVECTVRFMWPLSVTDGLYEDALERIWTKRIGVLKESRSVLVSGELLKWEDDLRKAVEDDEVYKRVRETNVRFTAVSFLNQLLEEQWAVFGCSSLESVARRLLVKKRKAGGGVRRREDVNGVVGERTRRRLGGGDEENGEDGDNRDCMEIDEQHGAEEEERAMLLKRKATADKGKAVDKGDGGVGCREDANARRLDEGEKENRDVHGVENDEQHAAEEEERTMGGAQEQEQEDEPSLNEGDEMAARTLKSYLLEIQLQINPSSSTRQVQESITPQPSRVNTRTGGTSSQQQDNNASERSSGRVRPRLATPVPLNVSPLKKKKASPQPRRKRKFWTPAETEALREGVKTYGNSWKYIRTSNPVLFADRTEVDLKDKWRNLTR